MIGTRKKNSIPVDHIPYKTRRFKMLFSKGFLFYAEYNLKLFFYLLFRRSSLLVANDLDTLLPNFLVSKLKSIPLVYDTHEYFTGSTEITNRPFVRNFWKMIEKPIFPGLQHVITVNDSIAELYNQDYGKRPFVVRNLPLRRIEVENLSRSQLGLPEEKKIVLLQGGAINIDRGAEELIEAMKYVPANVVLYLIGGGDLWDQLKQLTHLLKLENKVFFLPRMPYNQLMSYTRLCDLGVTLDKPVSINYRFSLPNKIFDYLAAGLPVLASPLVEVKRIIDDYKVGLCIENHNPVHIAETIDAMMSNPERLMQWKKNALEASEKLCWENEEKVLEKVYAEFIE
jgi:glycosyltransferase involved in cell wall biosynthesis